MLERIGSSGERVYRVQRDNKNLQELADSVDDLFDDIEEDEYKNDIDDEENNRTPIETPNPIDTPTEVKRTSISIPNKIEPIQEPKLKIVESNKDTIDTIADFNLSFRKGTAILKIVEGDIQGAIKLLEKEIQ